MSEKADKHPTQSPQQGQGQTGRPNLRLFASPDKMQAVLSGDVPADWDQSRIKKALGELLRSKGVKFGLIGENLRQAIDDLEKGLELKKIVVAQGVPPTPGLDWRVEVLVESGEGAIGRENQDGHVDFKDQGPLPVVEKGAPLAKLIAGQKGSPGCDITAAPVSPPAVKVLRLRPGKCVSIEHEGSLAVSKTRGLFNKVDEDKFEVLEVYEIEGDVDYNTGHIDFSGLVKVSGAVLSGFKVSAAALEATEMEPGSEAAVDGHVTTRGGIMGAKVKAGGSVKALYIRDSEIEAGGDLSVESEIVSSTVKADGKVTVTSNEGRIVNSFIHAAWGASTGEIISSGQATKIQLGVRKELHKALAGLRKKMRELAGEQEILREGATGQADELLITEQELREIIIKLKDEQDHDARENLKSQLGMIKPLRETLKEGLDSAQKRLGQIEEELYGVSKDIQMLEGKVPNGPVWLDVRGSAATTTEILTTQASLVLEQPMVGFSAREVISSDEQGAPAKPVVKLSALRPTQK